jgi:exosortase
MNEHTKRDFAWAVLMAAVFAASPLTGSARPLVSLVLGGGFGAVSFFARRLLRSRYPARFEIEQGRSTFAIPSAGVWALLAATTLVFIPTLSWLWDEYVLSIWRNCHALFIPIVMTVMIRSRLRAMPSHEPSSSLLGVPLLLVGALLALLDVGPRTGYVGTVGLILALPALSLLLLGAERTRAIAFPLALGVFLLPMPDRVPDPLWLTTGTSVMMEQYLHALSIPAMRHQSFFVLPVGMFNVSTNCGGLAFFYAAYALAVVLTRTTTSPLRRFVILLAPWPLTVVINGVRGMVLVALCNRYGMEIGETFVHGLTGIATMWLITLALLCFGDWKAWFTKEPA